MSYKRSMFNDINCLLFIIQADNKSLICPKEIKISAFGNGPLNVLYEPLSEISEKVMIRAVSVNAGSFL